MVDINIYRSRIGLFSPNFRRKKFLNKSQYYDSVFSKNENQSGKKMISVFQSMCKLIMILTLLYPSCAVPERKFAALYCDYAAARGQGHVHQAHGVSAGQAGSDWGIYTRLVTGGCGGWGKASNIFSENIKVAKAGRCLQVLNNQSEHERHGPVPHGGAVSEQDQGCQP